MKMQTVHLSKHQQQSRLASIISKDRSPKHEEAKHVGNVPLTRRSPSPRPVPAPRDDAKKPPSARRRKELLPAAALGRPGDGEPVKQSEAKGPEHNGKKKDQPQAALADSNEGDVATTDPTAAQQADVVKDPSSNGKSAENSRPANSQPSEPKEDSRQKKDESERTGKEAPASASKREETGATLPKTAERQPVLPTEKPCRPQHGPRPCVTEVEQQLVERLRQQMLNHDEVLLRYKSTSSFLQKYVQSHVGEPARQQLQAAGEPEQPGQHSKLEDAADAKQAKAKEAYQTPKKTSDAVASRRRGKTVQKTDPKVKKAPEEGKKAESEGPAGKGDEPYDSAVLRAIKAEEEHEKSGARAEVASSVSRPVSPLDESETSRRATAGYGDCDRSSTHEAGRRLAKLRKRLEDSLEQIQRQPGLDRELVEKARSVKMKRRREELEKIVLMKNDILEFSSLSRSFRLKESKEESSTKPTPPADTRPSVEVPEGAAQVSLLQASSTSDVKADMPDGEPTAGTRQKQPSGPGALGAEGPPRGAERRDHATTPFNCSLFNTSPNATTHSAADGSPAVSETAGVWGGFEKCPEKNINAEDERKSGNCEVPCKVDPSEQAKCKAVTNISDNVTLSVQTALNTTSRSEPVGAAAEHTKGVSRRSRKILDEDSLDAILEHQQKRREHLRQRKRSPIKNTEAALTDKARGDHNAVQAADGTETRSESLAAQDSGSKQQVGSAEKGNQSGGVETKCSKQSAISPRGSQFRNPSTPRASDLEANKESREETARVGDQPPLVPGSDTSHCAAGRSLRHLRYEEPDVKPSAPGPCSEAKMSPEKMWSSLDAETALLLERESSARRKVRWRRQAERAERQRTGADDYKTPPPIPPKMTRLNDIVDSNARLLKCGGQEDKPPASCGNRSARMEAEGKEPADVTRTPTGADPQGCDDSVHNMTAASSLVRGSFICAVRDKNAAVVGGQTGLVNTFPENVEICEESSLTPSKAATVFDPKAQLEREKEKLEAERAARSKMEGMPSPQFKANVHLFEQAAASDVLSIPLFPDSKVKANVKMFEDASRGQRAASVSPERPVGGRTARSPSSARGKPDCVV